MNNRFKSEIEGFFRLNIPKQGKNGKYNLKFNITIVSDTIDCG